MANNYKHLEIVSKKGIAGKKSTLVSICPTCGLPFAVGGPS